MLRPAQKRPAGRNPITSTTLSSKKRFCELPTSCPHKNDVDNLWITPPRNRVSATQWLQLDYAKILVSSLTIARPAAFAPYPPPKKRSEGNAHIATALKPPPERHSLTSFFSFFPFFLSYDLFCRVFYTKKNRLFKA